MKSVLSLLGILFSAATALAQDEEDKGFLGLDKADIRMKVGPVDMLVSGIVDLEYYQVDQQAPGLIFADYPYLNRRLSMFVDMAVGDHLFIFFQGRADEGFDPHYDGSIQMRADEYFARYTIGEEGWSAAAQVGKFATPIGNWAPRHDSMHNAMVRAPIVYDYLTTVSDQKVPATNQALINRRDHPENRHTWLPMIWGPDYAAGAMVFGSVGPVEARFAVTDGAPCERPEEWAWRQDNIHSLTYAGRIGWTPFLGLKVGASFAYGAYFSDDAESILPAGTSRRDFLQRLFGFDIEYAIGHLETWAELYWTEWDVPNIQDRVTALGYYVEGKYTILPRLYLSARWGQILFNNIADASGGSSPWDRNTWRLEFGVGYFIYENLLAKAEYEINYLSGPTNPHENMASFSLSLSF